MNVGQPMVAATMAKGQPLVVDAELMQKRRVDVVNVDRIDHRRIAELVGLAVSHAAAKSAAGHEQRVTVDMVIASAGGGDGGGVRRASHLAGPHDDRLIEQAALVQILDQRRDRAIGDECVLFVVLLQMAMLIPRRIVAVETGTGDFDKPHARFDQPPRPQCLRGIEALVFVRRVDAIELANVFGLVGDVADRRHFALHPKRRFVIRDRTFDRAGGGNLTRKSLVLALDPIEQPPLRWHVGGGDHVVDRVPVRADHRRLAGGGQVRATKILQAAVGNPVVVQDHVARQVLIFTPQPIRNPSPHARCLTEDPAGVQQQVLLAVQRQLPDQWNRTTQSLSATSAR